MKTRPTVDYALGLKRCSFCKEWLPFDRFSPSPHKNGGCGLKSYCRACDKVRYPYKPRADPKLQPKQHIFDIVTREELRQCSQCFAWLPLRDYYRSGRHLQHVCIPCSRAYARGRIAADRQGSREASRAYARAHPDKVKARMAKWRVDNRERLTAYNRSPAKRAKSREYMRKKTGTDEHRAYQREYDRRTGKGAEKAARRRAKMLGVTVELVDRNAIIKRDGRMCYLCGTFLKWREVTLDHVIPLARGGAHTAANLRVACGPCNFSKQHRLIGQLPLAI